MQFIGMQMNICCNTIELGDICLNVVHKNIKNVHLSVHPPQGRVTIAVPLGMNTETIRLVGISKLGWIRKQQTKFRNQKRETAREYVNHESHYYLGQRYLLQVIEQKAAPRVVLKHDVIELYIRKDVPKTLRKKILYSWYRQQLKELIPQYIAKLEKQMNVKVSKLCIRTMKTRWGTCNPRAKRIWLNTELAKKSIESIVYVLAHEMVHLLERHHNANFAAYMDKFLPNWKYLKEELKRSVLGHVE